MIPPNSGAQFDSSGKAAGTDDVPTPPTGFPVPDGTAAADESAGQNLADVIRAEDVGTGAPAVFGVADSTPEADSEADPGQWPRLRQRKPAAEESRRGMFDWLRRGGGGHAQS